MADHNLRLQAFVKLGYFLREYCEYAKGASKKIDIINPLYTILDDTIILAGHKNGWFTQKNVLYALEQWGNLLTQEGLTRWMSNYKLEQYKPMKIAIIMAGNIPLVGFHDFLSTMILGNSVVIKLSTNDKVLLPCLVDILVKTEPSLKDAIVFQDHRLEKFDLIIATGSNNTSRYFDYYFKDKPRIIRRNRYSAAILTGNETPEMLRELGNDVFNFFGLGCRSVSKLYVPEGYSFDPFFEAIYSFKDIIELAKYANNYDYNKAVYLMSEFQILDNGFLMLKEDKNFGSPIATLFYEHYASIQELKDTLALEKENLQCIVAHNLFPEEVVFGHTQCPGLADYADGVDTVEFLLKTSHN